MNLQDRKIETLEAEVIRLRYSNEKLVEELEVAKADTARLDKVERMQADVKYRLGGGWVVIAYNKFAADTVRAAIDGVPE